MQKKRETHCHLKRKMLICVGVGGVSGFALLSPFVCVCLRLISNIAQLSSQILATNERETSKILYRMYVKLRKRSYSEKSSHLHFCWSWHLQDLCVATSYSCLQNRPAMAVKPEYGQVIRELKSKIMVFRTKEIETTF